MWVKRDHEAEWKRWVAWLDHVAARVAAVPGVTSAVEQPKGLSNKTPSLIVRWSREKLGRSGGDVMRELLGGTPRIAVFARDRSAAGAPGAGSDDAGVSITPYMMAPGDERVIADRLHAILTGPRPPAPPAPAAPATDLTGEWAVDIEYAASRSTHAVFLRQQGGRLEGAHRGEFISRPLSGSVEGAEVRFRSWFDESHGDSLSFSFAGTVAGDTLSGTLDMGEYLSARWSARRKEVRS
jgi:L-seryl-tRNA(Ser) seleniumtransferase